MWKSLKSFYDALGIEAYLPADKAWMKGWVTGAWRAAESSDGLGGRAPDGKEAMRRRSAKCSTK